MAGIAVQYSLHAMLLSKEFTVPSYYQFLVYAVILHSCSYVAHIQVAEAQCSRECPLSFFVMSYNAEKSRKMTLVGQSHLRNP
jgi:hypothetical protein